MVIRLFTPHWLRSPSTSSSKTLTRQSLIGRFDGVLSPTLSSSSSSSSAADGIVRFGRQAEENYHHHQHQQQQTQEPSRRRTRRRTRLLQDNAAPSLADFIHRAKVLKQYRKFVRLAQHVDGKDSTSGDGATTTTTNNINKAIGCHTALEEVRLAFKMGMKIGVDAMAKNMAVVEGERKLHELERTIGYYSSREQSPPTEEHSYDPDSWINIQDEADIRGRVGMQWPWEQDTNIINNGK